MSGVWNCVQMDVLVDYDDFMRAHEEALEAGREVGTLTVEATVDIEEALEEATIEQLRDALGRELPGYTQEQLDAIEDCFSALGNGDFRTAEALLSRIFEHRAQIIAAENGLRALHRRAA